jgi:curved DNA-binding protein CbpA
MLLKKPALIVCFSSNLSASSVPSSITSSRSPRQQLVSTDRSLPRSYATVHHGSDGPSHIRRKDDYRQHQWPATPRPTPYDIFGQEKGAPYSKKIFYELVKIYHPDLHHHNQHYHPQMSNNKLARLVRLERYRLIVTANNILSDPTRRRAYDLYGAGWDGLSDMHRPCPESDRSWRREPDNASMNATWEDWERWYQRRQHQHAGSEGEKREPQKPIFMPNSGFAIGVLMCIAFGGYAQSVRVGQGAMNLINLRDENDAVISAAIKKRMESSAGLSRDDRVENFLRQRDAWATDRSSVQDMQEEDEAHK